MIRIVCIFGLTLFFAFGWAKDSFAYGYLTHIELMKQTMKSLGMDFWSILNIYSLSAILGAIGPNLFWKKEIVRELHEDIFLSLPFAMADYIKSLQVGEKREKLRAFLYGYLTHIAGDFHGHSLAHRLSHHQEHNWKLWRIFLHQDLYIGLRYHSSNRNRADIKIDLYELDTEIVQMWYQVYQQVSGAKIKLRDFMSNYDYTRLAIWWLTKEISQPGLRIFLPYQAKRGYIEGLDNNFETAKQTAIEFIKVTDEFLHGLEWHREGADKMKAVINKGYRLRCDWR